MTRFALQIPCHALPVIRIAQCDPAVIEYHLLLMLLAGIDGPIVDIDVQSPLQVALTHCLFRGLVTLK